jgi:O-antigen/teichoic acid export membrane protein
VIPIISDLHARGQQQELQRLVVHAVQACAVVAIPVALLLGLGGPMILRWYGPHFADAYPVMMVLSAAQVLHATIGIIAGFLLTMTGHESQAGRVIIITALLNLALTFALTPLFGAVGAASATAIAGIAKLGWLWVYARQYLGVSVLPYQPRVRQVNIQ